MERRADKQNHTTDAYSIAVVRQQYTGLYYSHFKLD